MIDLFWNLYQQTQIAELKAVARAQNSDTSSVSRHEAMRQIQELSDRLDRMVMAMQAMWTLVEEHTALTSADLARRITEIDARDGTLDGRVTPRPMKCSCGATVAAKFRRCLFCGKDYSAEQPVAGL